VDRNNSRLTEVEFDRLPSQVLRRRSQFFVRYLIAKVSSRTVANLLPIVERAFSHPWVASVELRIRWRPGNETELGRLWRLHKLLPGQSMHWDAPITVSVFQVRRGKKRQALCMSLYLVGNRLHIAQIQGVSRTDVPKELRAWPKMFIEACRAFGVQENLREVSVAKAETLYSYRNPYLSVDLLPEARQNALRRIRRNMKLLYDTNALELGFVPDGDWYRWKI
jgi:hypothetical protein